MYFSGQSQHFILIDATFVVFFCSWMSFYCVSYCVPRSKCYSYLHIHEYFCDFLVSFSLCVEVAHFVLQCCGSISVFCWMVLVLFVIIVML
jgi:hypothetical protein